MDNAVNRLGGSQKDARDWSLFNDPHDSRRIKMQYRMDFFTKKDFKIQGIVLKIDNEMKKVIIITLSLLTLILALGYLYMYTHRRDRYREEIKKTWETRVQQALQERKDSISNANNRD